MTRDCVEVDLVIAGFPWETIQKMGVRDVLRKYSVLIMRQEQRAQQQEEEWLQEARTQSSLNLPSTKPT